MSATAEATRLRQGEERHEFQVEGPEGFEALRRLVGDKGGLRLTYDASRRAVELMSPGQDHEELAELLADLLGYVAEEIQIPFLNLATTTWEGPVGSLQADKCFYFANFARVWRKTINLAVDPPPDLAIEVEISRPKVPKEPIYAGLGVPEVWRLRAGTIQVLHLVAGAYVPAEVSLALPFLRPAEVVDWLDRVHQFEFGQIQWSAAVRAWAREVLAPRRNAAGGEA